MNNFSPKKGILSRYSVNNINSKYYGSIDVASGTTTSDDVIIGVKHSDQGYIYAPYIIADSIPIIIESTEERAKRRRKERRKKMERVLNNLF